jgi:ferredoxin-NADP reductase
MLHELVRRAQHRATWWVHGARSADQYPLAAEIDNLLSQLTEAHRHVFFSAPEPTDARRRAVPGRINADTIADLTLPSSALVFLCGPTTFMADVREALRKYGLPPDRVRSELFGARPSLNPGMMDSAGKAPHQPAGARRAGPHVTFARSGLTATFTDEDRSILELAEACDVPTRWSCRTGVCHNCATTLLTGDVAYAPSPLDPPAPGHVLICCARPQTDLVVDL